MGFLPAEILGKHRKNHTRLRLAFGGSRTIQPLSGGAAIDDQQQ